jgi:hypothetical protein
MLLALSVKAETSCFWGLAGKKQLIHPKLRVRTNKKISFSATKTKLLCSENYLLYC